MDGIELPGSSGALPAYLRPPRTYDPIEHSSTLLLAMGIAAIVLISAGYLSIHRLSPSKPLEGMLALRTPSSLSWYSLASGKTIPISVPESSTLTAISFSPNSIFFAAAVVSKDKQYPGVFVARSDGAQPINVAGGQPGTSFFSPVISNDGTRIAYRIQSSVRSAPTKEALASGKGVVTNLTDELMYVSLGGDGRQTLKKLSFGGEPLAFSPSGTELLLRGITGLQIASVAGSNVQEVTGIAKEPVRAVTYAYDWEHFAYATSHGVHVGLIDWGKRAFTEFDVLNISMVTGLFFDQSGHLLISSSAGMHEYAVEKGKAREVATLSAVSQGEPLAWITVKKK